MSVIVTLQEGKPHLTISKGDPNFTTIVQMVKKYGGLYNSISDTKHWVIPLKRIDFLMEDLEDITVIEVTKEDRQIIESLKAKFGSKIENYRVGVSVDDFKMPPIKGKPPYEDYQFEDIIALLSTNRLALNNDMGTGKSYELITALDVYRRTKGLKKVLFVTSNSGTLNIEMEFKKFSDFSPAAIGDKVNRRPFVLGVDVIVINYRSLLLVSDDYAGRKNYLKTAIPIAEWLDHHDGALILDESHFINNPKSRQSKIVKMIAPYFKYIYTASGTPFDEEWKAYSSLNILDPTLVKNLNYGSWCQEYFIPNRFSIYQPESIRPDKKEELQSIIKGISIRRFGKDVLALPENFIDTYYVPFTPEHKKVYQKIVMEYLERIKRERGALTSRAVIEQFQGLILAIDNPELMLRHEEKYSADLVGLINKFQFEKHHSKVEALVELMEKHKNSKVVVWTSHPSVGDKLSEILKQYNPLVLHGESIIPKEFKTRDHYKMYIKELFENSTHQVLIAGEQVLNTSITMIVPNVQIYFDTDFNYTNRNQSEKRIYRIGQTQDVYTYNLTISESLDVVRAKNLQDKDFVNNKFLSKDYISLDMAQEMFSMKET